MQRLKCFQPVQIHVVGVCALKIVKQQLECAMNIPSLAGRILLQWSAEWSIQTY